MENHLGTNDASGISPNIDATYCFYSNNTQTPTLFIAEYSQVEHNKRSVYTVIKDQKGNVIVV